MKPYLMIFVLVLFLSGCAPKPPTTDLQGILNSLSQARSASSVVALDTSNAVYVQIDQDTIGLEQALKSSLQQMGVTIVDQPDLAQARITGEVIFVGSPEKSPDMRMLGQSRGLRTAAVVRTTTAVALGAASPASLVSSGLNMMVSGASRAFGPTRLKGLTTLYLNQDGQLREIRIDRMIEAKKDQAHEELVRLMTRDAIRQLAG